MLGKIRSLSIILLVLLISAGAVFAGGEKESSESASSAYPEKPINFLIPFGAGGSADLMGRALVNSFTDILGQPGVPVNRPGAGGGIMYTELEKAAPDGYTVGWNSTSILTTTNIGNVPFKYDAFDNLCRIGFTSMPLAVKADAPWNTIEELAVWAEKNPGALKIGNAGTGSGTHLTAVMFEQAADLKVIHVPLGAKRRVPSLLGGEVEAICVPLPEAAPQALAGKMKILAVSTADRDPAFPDVPTFKERGFDVVMDLFRGISMPKGTDPVIEKKLEAAFEAASKSEQFVDIAKKKGFNVSFMGSNDFAPYLADQNKRIADAMKAGGLVK